MSFLEGVRSASPEVFGDYLFGLVEGLFGAIDDPEGFLVTAVLAAFFCLLWIIVLGIVSAVAETFSAGGFQGLGLK